MVVTVTEHDKQLMRGEAFTNKRMKRRFSSTICAFFLQSQWSLFCACSLTKWQCKSTQAQTLRRGANFPLFTFVTALFPAKATILQLFISPFIISTKRNTNTSIHKILAIRYSIAGSSGLLRVWGFMDTIACKQVDRVKIVLSLWLSCSKPLLLAHVSEFSH